MISRKAVVQVCNILIERLSMHTTYGLSNNQILFLITDLKKVKSNQSYKKTIEAIEEELRWRFGKDY